ncbi:sigma-70 family RNA polymerase sigma factor [Pyxidicoccus parkwayensis]|uniref:Sigma-70 family RNA polymerase sigma factor n=1 Tax=Pyxidicoccus parkwayensis TaxID=2813578 RepID=A0ABX7NJB7_9BACT|nr:sigma-70 family RNA polymerase sigma factor [Pyxidicoccus parkwaysis]QSQ18960.1 sigma-70 family RNA polymerase sigma factor [Pyxidicoccus parkwaysis]
MAKLGDAEALEQRLRARIEEARQRFPDVTADEVAFVGHMAERLSEEGDLDEALSSVEVADLWLSFACLCGHALALRELDSRLDVEVRAALRGLGARPELADEVKSVLGDKLLVGEEGAPKLASYTGLGPLSAWLRVAALRTGISLQRGVRREVQADERSLLEAMDPALDPESRLMRERHAELLRTALREAMASLSPRERNLLRLYYADGLKLDRLAVMHRVNASTISRWLARAREDVLERTRTELGAHLKLSASQVESVLGLARSLDVSLESLLRSRSE